MCVGQDAIVTRFHRNPFSGARIYKLLPYPSVKDFCCLPRPQHFLLASSRVHIPLSLSWLSFLAADRLNRSPPVSPGGTTSCLDVASPRQQRCANSFPKRKKPSPRRRDYATLGRCPIAVGHPAQLHPLCIDTAFSQRLLSRRFFRVAQIQEETSSKLLPLQVSDRITGLLVCACLWKTKPADTKRITPQSLRRATGSTRTARRHELCERTPSSCAATQATAFRPRTSPVTGIRRYRTSTSWEANPTPFLLGRQPSILG